MKLDKYHFSYNCWQFTHTFKSAGAFTGILTLSDATFPVRSASIVYQSDKSSGRTELQFQRMGKHRSSSASILQKANLAIDHFDI